MELISYLNAHFYTTQQLLSRCKVSEHQLRDLQEARAMPLASYTLKLDIHCDSFFGGHDDSLTIEYYAKGYVSWLGILQSCDANAFDMFAGRYRAEIARLKSEGHQSAEKNVNEHLDIHIESEWHHFLDGTYGLCTKSGLPEDVAAKEFAILQIKELTQKGELALSEIAKLNRAVNLLDEASSMFAPHERARSSRHRLVDEVRKHYQL